MGLFQQKQPSSAHKQAHGQRSDNTGTPGAKSGEVQDGESLFGKQVQPVRQPIDFGLQKKAPAAPQSPSTPNVLNAAPLPAANPSTHDTAQQRRIEEAPSEASEEVTAAQEPVAPAQTLNWVTERYNQPFDETITEPVVSASDTEAGHKVIAEAPSITPLAIPEAEAAPEEPPYPTTPLVEDTTPSTSGNSLVEDEDYIPSQKLSKLELPITQQLEAPEDDFYSITEAVNQTSQPEQSQATPYSEEDLDYLSQPIESLTHSNNLTIFADDAPESIWDDMQPVVLDETLTDSTTELDDTPEICDVANNLSHDSEAQPIVLDVDDETTRVTPSAVEEPGILEEVEDFQAFVRDLYPREAPTEAPPEAAVTEAEAPEIAEPNPKTAQSFDKAAAKATNTPVDVENPLQGEAPALHLDDDEDLSWQELLPQADETSTTETQTPEPQATAAGTNATTEALETAETLKPAESPPAASEVSTTEEISGETNSPTESTQTHTEDLFQAAAAVATSLDTTPVDDPLLAMSDDDGDGFGLPLTPAAIDLDSFLLPGSAEDIGDDLFTEATHAEASPQASSTPNQDAPDFQITSTEDEREDLFGELNDELFSGDFDDEDAETLPLSDLSLGELPLNDKFADYLSPSDDDPVFELGGSSASDEHDNEPYVVNFDTPALETPAEPQAAGKSHDLGSWMPENVNVLESFELDDRRSILLVTTGNIWALMGEVDGQATPLKIFQDDPLETGGIMRLTKEASANGKEMYLAKLGTSWQGVISTDANTMVLHTELPTT